MPEKHWRQSVGEEDNFVKSWLCALCGCQVDVLEDNSAFIIRPDFSCDLCRNEYQDAFEYEIEGGK